MAAVDEERFTRQKHTTDFPVQSIRYCLEQGGIELKDIDQLATTNSLLEREFRRSLMLPIRSIVESRSFARSSTKNARAWLKFMARDARNELSADKKEELRLPLYLQFPAISSRTKLVHVEHHWAHAASAFYTSGMQSKSLVVTADGIGAGLSLAVWTVTEGRLDFLYGAGASGSLGWFYGLVTEGLGWWVGDGEGKTMGLAPYGDAAMVPDGALESYLPQYTNGRLSKPHSFGSPSGYRWGSSMHWHFREAPDLRDLADKYGRENLAAKAQQLIEREMISLLRAWQKRTGATQLATAGGLFQNVKLNQKIVENELFEEYFVFPCPADSGLAVGAALQANFADSPYEQEKIRDIYWGPEFTNEYCEKLLQERGLSYRRVENPCEEAAAQLAKGRIVAWFQGRMEYGPRALGGRSILMSPTSAENKDIINARVKYREAFRPFCPSMKFEAAGDFLEVERPERYMITAYKVRPEASVKIPSVVHVDGTCRPQLVEKDIYPRFWELLDRFEEKTGVPVLLNTSFNIKGEPIICHPREAIRCFFDTGIDVLILQDCVLEKDLKHDAGTAD